LDDDIDFFRRLEHAMTVRRRKILLIVDDNRMIRSLIRAIFENHFSEYDLEILTATSSDLALQIIEQRKGDIDLITSNIHRPGMDGHVFSVFLRFKHPQIKILLCSGRTKHRDLQEMLESGIIDAFVRKPISERDLVEKARAIFESQKLVRVSFPSESETPEAL